LRFRQLHCTRDGCEWAWKKAFQKEMFGLPGLRETLALLDVPVLDHLIIGAAAGRTGVSRSSPPLPTPVSARLHKFA